MAKKIDIAAAKHDLDTKIGNKLDPIYIIYPFKFEYVQGGQYLELYARDKTRKARIDNIYWKIEFSNTND